MLWLLDPYHAENYSDFMSFLKIILFTMYFPGTPLLFLPN